jgi:hypothetical protein
MVVQDVVMDREVQSVWPRIMRGLAFLDEVAPPDWRSRINIDTLEVGSCELCVTAQALSTFYPDACDRLGLDPCGDKAVSMGFNVSISGGRSHSEMDHELEVLTRGWKMALLPLETAA